ncbi:hypothetical protein ABPG74_020331 [Tetrahymena malaccensis]
MNISELLIQDYQSKFEELDETELMERYNHIQKSNYLKNILRSFYVFMLNEGDEIVIESIVQDSSKTINQIRKEFNAFIKNKKLNQSTLVSFMKSKRFSQILYYYLCYYSYDWIMKGSISDIETHILCITYMKKCLKSDSLLNQIKVYKKQL